MVGGLAASYSSRVMIALLAVILSDRQYRDLFPDSGKESRSAAKIELVSKKVRWANKGLASFVSASGIAILVLWA
jgi:hypothetical protein